MPPDLDRCKREPKRGPATGARFVRDSARMHVLPGTGATRGDVGAKNGGPAGRNIRVGNVSGRARTRCCSMLPWSTEPENIVADTKAQQNGTHPKQKQDPREDEARQEDQGRERIDGRDGPPPNPRPGGDRDTSSPWLGGG